VQAVVDSTRPQKAIRERLVELLDAASIQAALRGREGGKWTICDASECQRGGEFRFLPEEDLLDAIAQSLTERKDSVSCKSWPPATLWKGNRSTWNSRALSPTGASSGRDEITHRS